MQDTRLYGIGAPYGRRVAGSCLLATFLAAACQPADALTCVPSLNRIKEGLLDQAQVVIRGRVVSESTHSVDTHAPNSPPHSGPLPAKLLVLESFKGPTKNSVIDVIFEACAGGYCQAKSLVKGEEGIWVVRDGHIGLCNQLVNSPEVLAALRGRSTKIK